MRASPVIAARLHQQRQRPAAPALTALGRLPKPWLRPRTLHARKIRAPLVIAVRLHRPAATASTADGRLPIPRRSPPTLSAQEMIRMRASPVIAARLHHQQRFAPTFANGIIQMTLIGQARTFATNLETVTVCQRMGAYSGTVPALKESCAGERKRQRPAAPALTALGRLPKPTLRPRTLHAQKIRALLVIAVRLHRPAATA